MEHSKGKLEDCLESNCRVLATPDVIVVELTRSRQLEILTREEDIAHIVKCWNEYDELKATNDELVETLEKYGKHDKGCNIVLTRSSKYDDVCTCGFEQALAKARSKE